MTFIVTEACVQCNPDWHRITRKKEPLAEHEKYKTITDKLDLLLR